MLQQFFLHQLAKATRRYQPRLVHSLVTLLPWLLACMDEYGLYPMHLAVRAGSRRVVHILLQHGADINGVDAFGRTPLTHAQDKSNAEMRDFLLSHGATATSQHSAQWASESAGESWCA